MTTPPLRPLPDNVDLTRTPSVTPRPIVPPSVLLREREANPTPPLPPPVSQPGPSGISNTDEEIPEGVDPSFLEALPPEMRREVLEQHRMLRLQQHISTQASTALENAAASGSTEVSPEFLAALPPSLQEEVLTQQRLEQQRQAAARANPDEPVDAASFFETLQPSLRTMVS